MTRLGAALTTPFVQKHDDPRPLHLMRPLDSWHANVQKGRRCQLEEQRQRERGDGDGDGDGAGDGGSVTGTTLPAIGSPIGSPTASGTPASGVADPEADVNGAVGPDRFRKIMI